jgi:acyl-CoA thioesterase FadM
MNLILRLILLVIRKLWKIEERHPLEMASAEFWCLPHDCDFHGHITNSRYGSFCDLARISAMFDQKALIPLVKQGCTPILTAQQLVNYKEIVPFQKFAVKSLVVGWDEKFWIFRHDFYQNENLKATVLAKGVFVRKKKIVPFRRVLEIAGHELISPALPADVQAWSDQVDSLYNAARRQARSS